MIFNHMEMEIKFDKNSDEMNDEVTEKFKILREIRNEGLKSHIIHRHGMNEEAFEVEAALIDAFPGLSNIVSGHRSNEFGPQMLSN